MTLWVHRPGRSAVEWMYCGLTGSSDSDWVIGRRGRDQDCSWRLDWTYCSKLTRAVGVVMVGRRQVEGCYWNCVCMDSNVGCWGIDSRCSPVHRRNSVGSSYGSGCFEDDPESNT